MVINALVRGIEANHDVVRFMPDAIESILGLTRRFWLQDAFPGKAVRLAKQCESAALRQHHELPDDEIVIDSDFVAEVFHKQTGLPRTILSPGSGRTPKEIEQSFDSRIFEQPEAVDVVAGLVLTIEQGMTDPKKPMGSLLFIGPSGVGKTETAKALAQQLFGSDDRLIRFDMSEFNTPLAVSRLIGTARQPDGELTNQVRLQPFAVVLFDEIEKAHSSIHDLLLQVLGDGRLTDAAGRTVDFRNAILVMTSNLGAASEDHWMGFGADRQNDRYLHYLRAAQDFFRPEFMGRIDHIVPFGPLTRKGLRRIARRTLHSLLDRRGLRQAQVMVDVDSKLIDHLIEDAVDPRYGARTLARRVEQLLITPLAHALTKQRAHGGLTRVSIKAFEGDTMDLSLEQIKHAPAVEPERLAHVWWHTPTRELGFEESPSQQAVSTPSESESVPASMSKNGHGAALGTPGKILQAQHIVYTIGVLKDRYEKLTMRPEVLRLTQEYQEILERFNDPKTQGSVVDEIAESFRQRGVFLERLGHVQERLESVLDPQGTGEYVMPLVPEVHRTRRVHWSHMIESLHRELVWLEVQLKSLLTRKSDAATLIIEGIAGPFRVLLDFWWRILGSLSEVLELDFLVLGRIDQKWWPVEFGRTAPDHINAFAVSTESPGVLALLRALEGYVWSPRLPSQGHHALITMRAWAVGTVEVKRMRALVTQMPEHTRELFVEFVEQRGQIQDLRLDHRWSIPEDRSDNFKSFSFGLAMARLSLVGEVYASPLSDRDAFGVDVFTLQQED